VRSATAGPPDPWPPLRLIRHHLSKASGVRSRFVWLRKRLRRQGAPQASLHLPVAPECSHLHSDRVNDAGAIRIHCVGVTIGRLILTVRSWRSRRSSAIAGIVSGVLLIMAVTHPYRAVRRQPPGTPHRRPSPCSSRPVNTRGLLAFPSRVLLLSSALLVTRPSSTQTRTHGGPARSRGQSSTRRAHTTPGRIDRMQEAGG